jgi:spore germination protein GerM
MLKHICKKKIIISTIILVLIFLLHQKPEKENNKINIKEEINYVNYEMKTNEVYLLDNNNLLNRVMIATTKEDKELIKELIGILTCDSEYKDKIPNNFKCVINKNTKINKLEINNKTLNIDFNEYLLDTDIEEKTIESLVYTLTSLDYVDNIVICINGYKLTILPKSNITLPNKLNRNIGINKKYNLIDTKNINKTTIYYINKINDNTYYTPITLINNDSRDKIEIIIDELSNKYIDNNLNSYLNSNTKVLDSYIENNIMHINFNENILTGFDENKILEEVIYTISLSISDNYGIKSVFFDVNNKEIAKTTIKSLEY